MRDSDQDPAVTIGQETVGVAVVLSVAGSIDMSTVPLLQQRLDEVLREPPAALIIDLRRVDFMASVGFGVLVGIVNDARLTYALVATGSTRRMLDLLSIDTVVDVYLTVAEALRRLGMTRS